MTEINQNPYSPRSASPGSSFNPEGPSGREYEIKRTYSRLIDQHHIALIGRRYIGKSSLLKYLCLSLAQSKSGYDLSHYTFTIINLKEQHYKCPDDFFNHICSHMISKNLVHIDVDIAFRSEYGQTMFNDILEQIKEQGSHTILVLDDFEQLTRIIPSVWNFSPFCVRRQLQARFPTS